MKKVAVILFNLGGPNNADAVQPFLYNLFMDDDIFKLPIKGGLRRSLMKFVTTKRAKSVVEKYREINSCPEGCLGPTSCSNRQNKVISDCCSSTNPITEWQRRSLQKHLNESSSDTKYKVITAMRYWYPSSEDALEVLKTFEADEVVMMPLYPQFSYTTTASSYNEWTRTLKKHEVEDYWKTHMITNFHLKDKYLASINQRIDEALEEVPEERRHQLHILFSAHGTPISFQKAGDPYYDQIKETMEAVMAARGKDYPYWLSFQSRVGPVEWLKPNTEDFLEVLHGYGIKSLVIVPISFVSDHIETVHEIGIEFKEIANELHMQDFIFTKGLNDMPLFIECMGDMIKEKVQEGAKDLVANT